MEAMIRFLTDLVNKLRINSGLEPLVPEPPKVHSVRMLDLLDFLVLAGAELDDLKAKVAEVVREQIDQGQALIQQGEQAITKAEIAYRQARASGMSRVTEGEILRSEGEKNAALLERIGS